MSKNGTTNYFNLLFRKMLETSPELQPRKVDTPDHRTANKCSKPEKHPADGSPCAFESRKARWDRAVSVLCKRWDLAEASFPMYDRTDPRNTRRLKVPKHHLFFSDLKRKLGVDEVEYESGTA